MFCNCQARADQYTKLQDTGGCMFDIRRYIRVVCSNLQRVVFVIPESRVHVCEIVKWLVLLCTTDCPHHQHSVRHVYNSVPSNLFSNHLEGYIKSTLSEVHTIGTGWNSVRMHIWD